MATPGPTRIATVVDTLIELVGTATGLQITDGPHLGELMFEAVCLGITDGPDRPGYFVEVRRSEGMGRPRLQEDFTVRCLLTISSGETSMADLRDRAAGLLGQIDTALRAAPVVDGAWDRVGFGSQQEWIPIQHPQGATVNVLFTVEGSSLL